MTEEEERLLKLQQVIDSGVTSTKTAAEQVNFRSLDEMERIEARLKKSIRGDRKVSVYYVRGRKGYR